jgi:hypothetical protein
MFSRIVTMHLKPNNVAQLTKAVDEHVLPLLRKQEGFKDAIFFVSPDGKDATAISMWDRKENAESYGAKAYPQVLETLTSLYDGSPQVMTYEVLSSTFHKIPSHAAV